MSVRNVLRNALSPRLLPEMVRKVTTRARYGFGEAGEAERWARQQAQPLSNWAIGIDPDLWAETTEYAERLRTRAKLVLAPLIAEGIDMGGGGSVELLYFLTRLRKPRVVLETGVAAGWSSCAVLAALERNGQGELRSSDFPYFRMDHPERRIGILVPDELKARWTLEIEGDRRNLRKLLSDGAEVDLVHYDSDKSRPGRDWFAQRIGPFMSASGILIWDDIVNNLAFRDRAAAAPCALVFDTPNGLVGLELSEESLSAG